MRSFGRTLTTIAAGALWTFAAYAQDQAPAAPAAEPPAAEQPAAPAPDAAANVQPASAQVPAQPQAQPQNAPAVPPQTADEAFTTRVKTLEEQVADLKEKIVRTKARLLLLQETVLGGDLSQGARAWVVHKSDMGSSLKIESVSYALDGAPVFTKVNQNGELDDRRGVDVFQGRIVPGQHQLALRLVMRGNGYGVFSYVDGYKIKVQNTCIFNAEAGKATKVSIVAFDKGGFTASFKDRAAVRCDIQVTKDTGKKPAADGQDSAH